MINSTSNVMCDLKNYCFSCVVKAVSRTGNSAGENVGYHCKNCNIDILCSAGIARQYNKGNGDVINVCPRCGRKLETVSYALSSKIQKGYKSYSVDVTSDSPLGLNATMEVPDWVFWAKPGDIAEFKAKVSPCVGNKELNCLIVVLNSKNCFST